MDLHDCWTNHTFYEPYPTIRSLLPRHYVGTLIGERGRTQRQIEKECGTKISFSTHFTGESVPPDRVLAIYGPPNDLGRTCAFIMKLLSSDVKSDNPTMFDLLIPEGIAEMLQHVANDQEGYKKVSLFEKFKFRSQLEMLLDDTVLPESTDVRLRIFFNPTNSSDLNRLSSIIIDLAEYMSEHRMETFSPNNVYYNLNEITYESNKLDVPSSIAGIAQLDRQKSNRSSRKYQFRLLLRNDHITIIVSSPTYWDTITKISRKYKATTEVERDIERNPENDRFAVLLISTLTISEFSSVCQELATYFATWFKLHPASLTLLLHESAYYSLVDNGELANTNCEPVWGQIQQATGVCFSEVACLKGTSGDRVVSLMGSSNAIMQGIKMLLEKISGEP